MRVTWISGWGVTPEFWRPLARRYAPNASHSFLPPLPLAADVNGDCLVGWSLGSWRVLEAAAAGVHLPPRVVLLAPFVAFCAEDGLGGRCARAQVRWLARWLQRDPVTALQDFFQRAELGPAPADLPGAPADLVAGLECLAAAPIPALCRLAAAGLPPHWTAVIGARDVLLDAAAVAKALPGCRTLPGVGHAAEPLLAAVPEVFDAV